MKQATAQPHSLTEAQTKSLEFLKSVNLFLEIRDNQEALMALASIVHQKVFKPGHDILLEGSEGTEMFILVGGTAAVYKSTPGGDPYKVAILNGDFRIAFGESGLIEAEKRTATIRCETECICLVIDRPAFEKFSDQYPAWALPVYRRIAHSVMSRLKKTNEDMLLLYNALVAEIRGS